MNQPRRTYLAALGNVNDPQTWSGIPYHFLQAAQANGLVDEGLDLCCDGPIWQCHRLLWNGWRYVTGRGRGGYQYSTSFLERSWQPLRASLIDQRIINCFQLFPPSMVENPRYAKVFYIDMTLRQLFQDYGIAKTIGGALAQDALEREKAGYQSAERVVCHSQWAARSVIDDYQIDPQKVAAIIPGANLDRASLQQWQGQSRMPTRQQGDPLKLVFVGKYWDRKGLDRLLAAMHIVQQQAKPIQLTVIGCQRNDLPDNLRDVPDVTWIDFIDKRTELPRFIETVSDADIGCLLSRAEAGGMVLREFHALGLIVMGTAVGGSPEHLFEDAGRIFSTTAIGEEIAKWLIHLINHPDELTDLRTRAWSKRTLATWDESVRQW